MSQFWKETMVAAVFGLLGGIVIGAVISWINSR